MEEKKPSKIKKGWWVDPPTGWAYGFPLEADKDLTWDELADWCIQHGYPESKRNLIPHTGITMID